ncbi:MAG: M23 family metallopeptidase [Gemmatimonadales bacterium]|nr:hypothetical protein [Myxococcales bacterium]
MKARSVGGVGLICCAVMSACAGGGQPTSVEADVTSAGGTLRLGDRATVTFPSGAFAETTHVYVDLSSVPLQTFGPDSVFFSDELRAPLALRVSYKGGSQPLLNTRVELAVPKEFASRLAASDGIAGYIRLFSEAMETSADEYAVPTAVATDRSSVLFDVAPFAFTDRTAADGRTEALIMLGSLSMRATTQRSRNAMTADATCDGAPILSPLVGYRPFTNTPDQRFGIRQDPSHPERVEMHTGMDVPVKVGTGIQAVADGTAELRYNPGGYGLYMVLQMSGGRAAIYGELSGVLSKHFSDDQINAVKACWPARICPDSLQRKVEVGAGDFLGFTGGVPGDGTNSTGPHIHFAYYAGPKVHGAPTDKSGLIGAVDPTACATLGVDPVDCNDLSEAGGDAPDQHDVKLNQSAGTFTFEWTMFTIPDRMTIMYEGNQLLDTGCIGGSGSQAVSFNGRSEVVTVKVTPNCSGTTGTAWNFTIHCPQ